MSGSLTIGIYARFKVTILATSLLFPLPFTYGFLPAILFHIHQAGKSSGKITTS